MVQHQMYLKFGRVYFYHPHAQTQLTEKKKFQYSLTENDEILRLSLELNKSNQEIRNVIDKSIRDFKPSENWK